MKNGSKKCLLFVFPFVDGMEEGLVKEDVEV